MVRSKKQADWGKFLGRIEDAYKNDHRQLWQLIERLLPSGNKAEVAPARGKDGIMAKSEEEIMEVWAEHQEFLGTPCAHELEDVAFAEETRKMVSMCSIVSPLLPQVHMDRHFEDEEIDEAVEALGYHKAAAADGTKNPFYKCGGKEMRGHLKTLFNHLVDREVVPEGWQRAVIANLFKEGDTADPGNYRGIALISCLGKLYLSLWARRLAKHAEGVLSEAQGGFRSRRSTVDQAISVKELLLREQRAGRPTYLCFVDFRKAFDTVWHDGLWRRLWESGVKGKAWRILRSLYSSVHAQVLVGGSTTRAVRMRQGVRQGCPLSPVLFNYFVDELSKQLKASGYGIDFDKETLSSLLYADDVVLFAHSAEELQKLIDVVDKFCRQWHMDINIKKSEVMVVGGKSTCHHCHLGRPKELVQGCCPSTCESWHCRGSPLKVVKKYKYLGIWFTSDLSWHEHVRVVLSKVARKTKALGTLFANHRVPARAKALVWLASARPNLEYGSEVWEPTAEEAKKMESAQVQAGNLMFATNSRTNAHAVRALMRVPSLALRRSRAKLVYVVKIKRMHGERLVRRIAGGGAVRQLQWSNEIQQIIAGDAGLRRAAERVNQCMQRNGNVLPEGLDPTLPDTDGKPCYDPVDRWTKAVDWWTKVQSLEATKKAGRASVRTTLHVLLRACEGEKTVPQFPLTRRPNGGPDQIRLRFLGGTSALRITMAKVQHGTSAECPHGCGVTEDLPHFLLRCKAYDDLRAQFRVQMETRCTCRQRLGEKSHDKRSCPDFFQRLNDTGKTLFMLGGPVDQRQPESEVDAAAREYVQTAYERRSALLNSLAADPLVADLTDGRAAQVQGRAGSVSQAPTPPLFPLFIPAPTTYPLFARARSAHSARRHVNASPGDRSARLVHARSVSARSLRAPEGQAADDCKGNGSNGFKTRKSV